jgi:hypothetical protein
MSVWPGIQPAVPSLRGTDGELVSVHITVEPKLLENLLEALAEVSFPINPQICHDATQVRNGRLRPAALVQFPAYAERLEEAKRVLRSHGFAEEIEVLSMLEEIQAT